MYVARAIVALCHGRGKRLGSWRVADGVDDVVTMQSKGARWCNA